MMKKSSPSAFHNFSSFATWGLIAFTLCLIAIPAGAVRSARETSPTREMGKAPGGLWANYVPTLFSAPPSVPLAGATINVNSTLQSPGNSGDCTLGEAILAANQIFSDQRDNRWPHSVPYAARIVKSSRVFPSRVRCPDLTASARQFSSLQESLYE